MKRGMRGTSALLWDGPGYEGKGTRWERDHVVGARARAHTGRRRTGGECVEAWIRIARKERELRLGPHLISLRDVILTVDAELDERGARGSGWHQAQRIGGGNRCSIRGDTTEPASGGYGRAGC